MRPTEPCQRARHPAGLAAFLGIAALAAACANVVVPASAPPPPQIGSAREPEARPTASARPAAAGSNESLPGAALIASSSMVSSATSPAPSASAAVPNAAKRPARVVVGEPKLEGGDVPKARAAIEKLAKRLAACADEHGGLAGDAGMVRVQLLVRAAGIAEGVDVLETRGLSEDAKRCVRDTLQRKRIGTPSSDPVGLTVDLDFSAAPAQP